MKTPCATYRLQFRNGMTFDRAIGIGPYLKRLGISHLYASPIFAAASGSTHGYDVTDHNEIDPTLGGRESFDRLCQTLDRAGIGLILDIVPNHMAASVENPWWRSVIEWGAESPFSGHFDIDWSERLTLPILGSSFEDALAGGDIGLDFDGTTGAIAITCYGNPLPLHPPTYAMLAEYSQMPELEEIAVAASHTSAEREAALHDALKERLADDPALVSELQRLGADHDFLSRLHDAQPWRLMFWQEARRHLSYRRFFEVTGLVGVRVEDDKVFDDVHRLTLELVRSGKVQGLRVDHVDGLADPKGYLDRLRQEAGSETYIVVEKILGEAESLPTDWPVSGTTGYEFITSLAGILADGKGVGALDRAYGDVRGEPLNLTAERRAAKSLMVNRNFAGELDTLVRIASEVDPSFNEQDIKSAIAEIIMAFPVYRTYGDVHGLGDHDRRLLAGIGETALEAAGEDLRPAVDFILSVLSGMGENLFRTRFQQLTGPVMAKAIEDTLFYRANSFIAFNEVGAEPETRGRTVEDFHLAMQERLENAPHALLATATHDTKRGEDARARLYVLSEAPEAWQSAVDRWRVMNTRLVRQLPDGPAPEPETEWLIYQALAGVWPKELDPDDADGLARLRERFLPYVEKALREAKLRTDWIAVDEPYEGAVKAYIVNVLSPQNSRFLRDFSDTLRPFSAAGWVNSLAQTLVKLTAPGIPDIYNGSEWEDLSLVDPDNRRPLDFESLSRELDENSRAVRLTDLENGAAKQALIAACLNFRAVQSDLFAKGSYETLKVTGPRASAVVAFMRRLGPAAAITVVPRLVFGLLDGSKLDPDIWGDTAVEVPDIPSNVSLFDVLAGVGVVFDGGGLALRTILRDLPVALLATKT